MGGGNAECSLGGRKDGCVDGINCFSQTDVTFITLRSRGLEETIQGTIFSPKCIVKMQFWKKRPLTKKDLRRGWIKRILASDM